MIPAFSIPKAPPAWVSVWGFGHPLCPAERAEDTSVLPIDSVTTAEPPSQLPAQPSASEAASVVPDSRPVQELHRQAAKQAQKDRVHRFLVEVDQSIAEGDQHVAFKTLKVQRERERDRGRF